MSSRTTCAAWVKGVVATLAGQGLDAGALLDKAGIDPASLDDPHARIVTEKVSALWQYAALASGNPAIGLADPHSPKPANFDVIGFAMMSCPDLRSALERLARYLRIVSDAAHIILQERDDGSLMMRFELFGGAVPMPRQRIEFDLITFLGFFRWLCAHKISPQAVELAWPRPANTIPYEEAFLGPVVFDAGCNGIVFAKADLDRAIPTSNPVIEALHDTYVQERLAMMDLQSIAYKVRALIIRDLPAGEPRREQIATALHLSERTLQRRLAAESTSFNQLLDETRCDLAQQYLAKPLLSLAEVAYLLGFADQSNFFRACRRWFSASPGQMRARITA